MAEEAGKLSGIEKFDGIDFAYWRMHFEDHSFDKFPKGMLSVVSLVSKL